MSRLRSSEARNDDRAARFPRVERQGMRAEAARARADVCADGKAGIRRGRLQPPEIPRSSIMVTPLNQSAPSAASGRHGPSSYVRTRLPGGPASPILSIISLSSSASRYPQRHAAHHHAPDHPVPRASVKARSRRPSRPPLTRARVTTLASAATSCAMSPPCRRRTSTPSSASLHRRRIAFCSPHNSLPRRSPITSSGSTRAGRGAPPEEYASLLRQATLICRRNVHKNLPSPSPMTIPFDVRPTISPSIALFEDGCSSGYNFGPHRRLGN